MILRANEKASHDPQASTNLFNGNLNQRQALREPATLKDKRVRVNGE